MGSSETNCGTPPSVPVQKKGREGEVIVQAFTWVKLLSRSYGLSLLRIFTYYSDYFTYLYVFKRFFCKTKTPACNVYTDKSKILKDNKNKSGIYLIRNLTNGKKYVGSSENLSHRLSFYNTPSKMEYVLKRGGRSAIYSAILKYGLDNFSIEILESHLYI
jgi:hypothetical protein